MREAERTCIGCGRRLPKGELARLVLVEGEVRRDPRQALPGRGAYLCGPGCVAAALKRRAFGRAFRAAARVDGDDLVRQLS